MNDLGKFNDGGVVAILSELLLHNERLDPIFPFYFSTFTYKGVTIQDYYNS